MERDSAHSIVYARLEVMKLPMRIHLSAIFIVVEYVFAAENYMEQYAEARCDRWR